MKWLALAAAILLLPATSQAQAPIVGHAPTWSPADGAKLEFDVLRDGGALGTHILTFSRQDDTLTVDTDINFKVAFGPITFFEYIHDVTERYVGGKLAWVGSRTHKDGKWRTLSAQATDAGLSVKGAGFVGVLKGLVIPSTHWNIAEMKQAAMFSTETGEMLPMRVTDRGIEQVATGAGPIEARRFDVKSELAASFWYDAQGRWVKCAFDAEGSHIEYVLRKLPR